MWLYCWISFFMVGIALGARSSGFQDAGELGLPDTNLVAFISELGELAARGEDIRPRVFTGVP